MKSVLNINIDLTGERFETTDEENKELIIKYRNSGDIEIKKTLIEKNLKLVIHVINKHYLKYLLNSEKNSGLDINDLFSFGIIGFSDAIERVKLNELYKFPSYAFSTIRYTIQRYIFKQQGYLSGAFNLYALYSRIQKIKKVNPDVTDEELSSLLDISLIQIRRAKSLSNPKLYYYLDSSENFGIDKGDREDNYNRLVYDSNEEMNKKLINDELKEFIDRIFEDKRIYGKSTKMYKNRVDIYNKFKLKYVDGLTFDQIGEIYKISKQRVQQIIVKVTNNIIEYYGEEFEKYFRQ